MNKRTYERVLGRLVGMATRYQRDVLDEKRKNQTEPGSFHFEEFLKARSVRNAYMHAAKILAEEWRNAQQQQKERRELLRRYPALRRAA